MAIQLGDDGTLDTVVFCTECGEEFRGTWEEFRGTWEDGDDSFPDRFDTDGRQDFIGWLIADVTAEHECPKAVN